MSWIIYMSKVTMDISLLNIMLNKHRVVKVCSQQSDQLFSRSLPHGQESGC